MLLPTLLVPPQFLTAASAAYYTTPVPANGQAAITAKISRAVFVNTTGGALTLTAGISNSGALTAATTLISVSIPANQTYVSPELAGAILPSGYALYANTSAGSDIIIMVSGLTIQ